MKKSCEPLKKRRDAFFRGFVYGELRTCMKFNTTHIIWLPLAVNLLALQVLEVRSWELIRMTIEDQL